MTSVLVAGASGYLGQHLVKSLSQGNFQVAALLRNKNKINHLNGFVKTYIEAEVTKPDTLKDKLQKIDVVVSTIGITKQRDGLTYMDVDYQANLNLLKEAQKCSVKKFIYVSVFNGEKLKNLRIIQAKLKFADALKSSGMDYLIVNPNGYFSDVSEIFKMAERKTVYLFGDGKFKVNPIDGKDLADTIVKNINSDKKEIEVGSPEILTQNQIAEIAFDVLGYDNKIRYVPTWVTKLLLAFLRFFTPVKVYGPIEFFMTVLTMDMVCDTYGKITLKEYFETLKK